MNKNSNKDHRILQVKFYPSEQARYVDLSRFLYENKIEGVMDIDIYKDETRYYFEYIGMPEMDWYGCIQGLYLRTDKGKEIVFAFWPEVDIYEDVSQEFRMAIAKEITEVIKEFENNNKQRKA